MRGTGILSRSVTVVDFIIASVVLYIIHCLRRRSVRSTPVCSDVVPTRPSSLHAAAVCYAAMLGWHIL